MKLKDTRAVTFVAVLQFRYLLRKAIIVVKNPQEQFKCHKMFIRPRLAFDNSKRNFTCAFAEFRFRYLHLYVKLWTFPEANLCEHLSRLCTCMFIEITFFALLLYLLYRNARTLEREVIIYLNTVK